MASHCDDDKMQIDGINHGVQVVDFVRWDGDPDPEKSDHQNNITSSYRSDTARSAAAVATTNLNEFVKAQEETTKKALLLRRNELKWKLMQASQTQNKARLDEIKQEMNYYKEKLAKTQELAVRLRERYVRVVKSAKLSENQLKKVERQFQSHEKYVADEKMELTKIALDCVNIGRTLYGESYKLPANPSSNGASSKSGQTEQSVRGAQEGYNNTANKSSGTLSLISGSGNSDNQAKVSEQSKMLENLAPFLRRVRTNANANSSLERNGNSPPTSSTESVRNTASTSSNILNKLVSLSPHKKGTKLNGSRSTVQKAITASPKKVPIDVDKDLRLTLTKRRQRCSNNSGRLSGIYDRKDSILKNIVSYRLISKFASTEQQQSNHPLTDLTYSHNNCPEEYVCLPDLISKCSDKNCAYKHKSSYMISDTEKLREILASRPAQTFNFLLMLQMDHKRPLPASLTKLAALEQPDDMLSGENQSSDDIPLSDGQSVEQQLFIKGEVADNPLLN